MHNRVFTGLPDDDRRIAAELSAMGAYDTPRDETPGRISQMLQEVGDFITWLRWKGEVGVYGCRVGVRRPVAGATLA